MLIIFDSRVIIPQILHIVEYVKYTHTRSPSASNIYQVSSQVFFSLF